MKEAALAGDTEEADSVTKEEDRSEEEGEKG